MYQLGVMYRKRGEFENSIRFFEHLMHRAPEDPRAYNELGGICLTSGDTDRARRYFESAIEADHSYAVAYYNLSAVYFETGRFSQALEYVQKAVEHGYAPDPKYVQAIRARLGKLRGETPRSDERAR